MTKCVGALVAATLVLASPAGAQDLKIALAAEPTSIDPLYHTLNPNNQVARHVFDRLVHQDARQRLVPGLALSWKPIGDAVWEFKLRPGVTFHDGAPLTPDDIIFSIDRADKVPNSPASFAIYTKAVKGIEVVDPLTLHIKTGTPYPLLPSDLSPSRSRRRARWRGRAPRISTTAPPRSAPGPINSWSGCPGTGWCSRATTSIGGRSPIGPR